MGNLRRLLLAVLTMLVAAVVAVPAATAETAPRALSVRMSDACAKKSTGQLTYVGSTAGCDSKGKNPTEKLVPIRSGPHYACVHGDGSVFLVAARGDCPVPKNQAALTLPPSGGPLYFCARSAGGLLTYTTAPGRCAPPAQFPVVVPVTAPPGPPVISGVETTALGYQAQDPPVPVAATLTISDDDDATMASASAAVTSRFDSGADTLTFDSGAGISGTFNASSGVLTLTGAASAADYQSALRTVKFASSDASASPASRTVSFTVTDSLGAKSARAGRVITVTRAPATPVAVDHAYNAVGNTPLAVGTSPAGPAATVSGSLLYGDTDPDPGSALTVTAHTTPAHGSVTVNPDGTFTYRPAAGYAGPDTFGYTIAAAGAPGQTASATITITVGTLVWYVDDSKSDAGNGEAGSPFSTLAAASAVAGASSVVFLYQGNADYAGGIALQPGESLLGQPRGLTVGGYALVAAGGSAPVITNSGGDGIDLGDGVTVDGVTVSGPSGHGIAAADVTSATVGGSAGVLVSGAGQDGVHVSGGAGDLDFGATQVTGSAGHSALVTGRSGGTVTFGGDITGHGTGISLTSDPSTTVTFTGTLTASTGANPAFTAIGVGAVSAPDPQGGTASTLTTTTGAALDVEDSPIGAGGLYFQSISSNGAPHGIILDNSSPSLVNALTSGSLVVTGVNGKAGSGGTIENSAGAGIVVKVAVAPFFSAMVIDHNSGSGISGTSVHGLTLDDCTVSGNGSASQAADGVGDGLYFGGGDGTVDVTGSTFDGNPGAGADIEPGIVGQTSVTFSGNTLRGDGDGVVVVSSGFSAAVGITVHGNDLQDISGKGIDLESGGVSVVSLSGSVTGNTIGTAGSAGSGAGTGIEIDANGWADTTLNVSGNQVYEYDKMAGIFVSSYPAGVKSPTTNVTIAGNTIADPAGSAAWGIRTVAGASSVPASLGTLCAGITGNTLTGSGQPSQDGADIELDQGGAATFRLPGYAGAAADTSAVESFVAAGNGGTPVALATVDPTTGGFTGGAACTMTQSNER